MKLLIGMVALALAALSVLVDYKWKQWIKTRQQERDHPQNSGSNDLYRHK
jgi:hypothetical protein